MKLREDGFEKCDHPPLSYLLLLHIFSRHLSVQFYSEFLTLFPPGKDTFYHRHRVKSSLLIQIICQQQVCYGSSRSSYALGVAASLWQQQLCYGSRYALAVAAMLWQEQVYYGSSSYTLAAAAMLWQLYYHTMAAMLLQLFYDSYDTLTTLFLLTRWLCSKTNKQRTTKWWCCELLLHCMGNYICNKTQKNWVQDRSKGCF